MKRTRWTDGMLFAEGKKYTSRKEFFKGSCSAYQLAKDRGIFEEVCAHMPKDKKIGGKPAVFKWTKEKVKEEASKFNSKTQFFQWARGAYQAAKDMGIMDEVCSHMTDKRRKTGTTLITDKKSYSPVTVINDLKYKAIKSGKVWSLSEDEAFILIVSPCYYCGFEPDWPYSRIGIDRVDNSKGYEISNCVSSCFTCNSAKSTKTLEEFKQWIKNIAAKMLKNESV